MPLCHYSISGSAYHLSLAFRKYPYLLSATVAVGLLAAGPAVAQDASTTEDETEVTADSLEISTSAESLRIDPLFRVGANTESGGIPASLHAFDGFFPVLQTPGSSITYLNPRLNIDFDDENRLGGSLVFGHRSYSPDRQRILGGYLALDVRDTGESVFPQIGFGFERLGKDWDIRANGYVPVGDTRQRTDRDVLTSSQTSTTIGEPTFSGNLLTSDISTTTTDTRTQIDRFEAALGGFDVEAGTRLASWNEHGELRLYGGLYYLGGHNVSSIGGRGRLEIVPTESIRLMAGIQGDPVFDVRGFFAASFLLPTPEALREEEANPDENAEAIAALGETVTRLADPVARDFNVVVDEQRDIDITSTSTTLTEEDVPYVNAATGSPWRFTHVALGGSSDGTFEDPFGTLQEGLDATVGDGNDIVYVALADDTEVPPFTIPDNVQVLSTGPEQVLDATLAGTSITSVVLPGSGDGNFPDVPDTVTLGNSTTLSGFDITGTTDSAVVGPAGLTGSVRVSENRLSSLDDDGVEINDISGDLDLLIANNTIDGVEDSGVDFDEIYGGTVEVRIQNNTIRNAGDDGVDFDSIYGNAVVDIEIADNLIENVDEGIEINDFFDTARISLDINNNRIEQTDSGAIYIEGIFDEAIVDSKISDNTIVGSGSDGVSFGNIFGYSGVSVEISRNTISESDSNGILFFEIYDNATAKINISDNRIVGSGDAGVIFYDIYDDDIYDGTVIAEINIRDNEIVDNDYGVVFDGFEDSTVSIEISDNTITDNESDGIGVGIIEGEADVEINILNNTVSDNGDDAIDFDGFVDEATVDIEISDNIIEGNDDNGIQIGYSDFFTNVEIDILRNAINENGEDGIYFDEIFLAKYDEANVDVEISGNEIANNSGDGIDFDSITGAGEVDIIIDDNILESNGESGIEIDIETGFIPIFNPKTNLTISKNTIENSDEIGIDIVNNSEETTLTVVNNRITDSGDTGLSVDNQTDGEVCLLLNGNTSTNLGFAGFTLNNDADPADFEIIDLSNITLTNTGSFVPADPEASGDFTDVGVGCVPLP